MPLFQELLSDEEHDDDYYILDNDDQRDDEGADPNCSIVPNSPVVIYCLNDDLRQSREQDFEHNLNSVTVFEVEQIVLVALQKLLEYDEIRRLKTSEELEILKNTIRHSEAHLFPSLGLRLDRFVTQNVDDVEKSVKHRLNHDERQLGPLNGFARKFGLLVVDHVRDPVEVTEEHASKNERFARLEASSTKFE